MPQLPILSANFQDQGGQNPDNTSAPPMPQVQQPLPAVLSAKLKKPSKLKNPGPLAAAISRAKRARQTGDKWGT
jgi:hypothetical protein